MSVKMSVLILKTSGIKIIMHGTTLNALSHKKLAVSQGVGEKVTYKVNWAAFLKTDNILRTTTTTSPINAGSKTGTSYDVTLPAVTKTLPEKVITVSGEKITISAKTVTIPARTVTIPINTIELPTNITLGAPESTWEVSGGSLNLADKKVEQINTMVDVLDYDLGYDLDYDPIFTNVTSVCVSGSIGNYYLVNKIKTTNGNTYKRYFNVCILDNTYNYGFPNRSIWF